MAIADLTEDEKRLIQSNKGKPIYIRGERYTVTQSGQALDRNGIPIDSGNERVVAPTATPDPAAAAEAEKSAAAKELARAKSVLDANPNAFAAKASYDQAKKKAKALGLQVEDTPPPTPTPTPPPTDAALDEVAGRRPQTPTDAAIDAISGTGMPRGLGSMARKKP